MNDCLYLYDAHHHEKSYPKMKKFKERAEKMACVRWRVLRADGRKPW